MSGPLAFAPATPMGRWTLAGGMALAAYKSMARQHLSSRRFTPQQPRKAGGSGSVKVKFTVDGNGTIRNVAVSGRIFTASRGLTDRLLSPPRLAKRQPVRQSAGVWD